MAAAVGDPPRTSAAEHSRAVATVLRPRIGARVGSCAVASAVRTRPVLRVAREVIERAELEARVAAVLQETDTSAIELVGPAMRREPPPYVDAANRAENLHQLWPTLHPPGIEPARTPKERARRVVKQVTRRLTHWYVEPRFAAQHEIDAEIARFATDAVLAIRRVHVQLSDSRREVEALRREVKSLRQFGRELKADHGGQLATLRTQAEIVTQLSEEIERSAAAHNEVRSAVDHLVTSVGGTNARNAELEALVLGRASTEEVAKLRDETAQVMSRLGVASARGADFDYVAFEDRFRGDSADLSESQREYVTKFPPAAEWGPIVDIGCGRGEMLELLREVGHDVVGVEVDDKMIDVCRSKGLDVVKADGVAWLEACTPGSLKGVFSAQVIEHMLTPEIERFLAASLAALRVGGVLVVETINPRSLHALANHFFADLSHVRPVHPETLRFMCEQTGFRDVALVERSLHPAVEAAGKLGKTPMNLAVKELTQSVFGFQDYAIIATRG
jgi:O-antigen chain-terminating methyltransferase